MSSVTRSDVELMTSAANGDVTANPVTSYRIKSGKSTTLRVIVPPNKLVKAA